MRKFRKYFLRGSLSHLIPLGAGFIIASSKTVEAALGMSLAITIVTVFTSIRVVVTLVHIWRWFWTFRFVFW